MPCKFVYAWIPMEEKFGKYHLDLLIKIDRCEDFWPISIILFISISTTILSASRSFVEIDAGILYYFMSVCKIHTFVLKYHPLQMTFWEEYYLTSIRTSNYMIFQTPKRTLNILCKFWVFRFHLQNNLSNKSRSMSLKKWIYICSSIMASRKISL